MITLNLDYKYGLYYMKIKSATEDKLLTLIKSFGVENYPLKIEDNNSVPTNFSNLLLEDFHIPIEYKNHYFKGFLEHYLTYNRNKYYIKLGLEGNKDQTFILSLSLAVFYKDPSTNQFKVLFEASGGILPKPLYTGMDNASKKKRYSNSVQYKMPKSITSDKVGYSLSDINDIDYLSKSISSKIFGLKNLGNTCFLNSSLQILIHSPLFIKRFLQDCIKLKEKNLKNTVTYEFFKLIMDINSSNSNVISPNKFISSFLDKCNLFSLGQQSDSQRFYRNLANIFEKEIGPQNTCIKNTFVGEIENFNIYNCSDCFCKYNEIKNSKQIFLDILTYASTQKTATLVDLINASYTMKIQNSSQICQCQSNLIFTRYTKIYPNEYLSINIQRGKIDSRTLKNTLISVTNLQIGGSIYELYAINFHAGISRDSGHYYSYAKIGNDWVCFNDENYTILNKFQLPFVSDSIINVFYRKYK